MAWINIVQASHLEEFPTIEHRVSIAKSIVSKENISSSKICAVLSTGIDIYTQPSDSIAIASGIGANHAISASINNSCASLSAAIDIAIHQIYEHSDKVAIVTSSSIFNDIERENGTVECANGVGAAIISNRPYGLEILKIKHGSNAKYFGLKTIEPKNMKTPTMSFHENKNSKIWADYRQAAVDFPLSVLKDALEEIRWGIADIDHWVLHNSEITKQWHSALGIETVGPITNMGSLTTLIQISDLLNSGKLLPGNKIAVVELGLGISASVILLHNGVDSWTG